MYASSLSPSMTRLRWTVVISKHEPEAPAKATWRGLKSGSGATTEAPYPSASSTSRVDRMQIWVAFDVARDP